MMTSNQKVIERSRTPRVQITYDVEQYRRLTTVELPFVLGLIADLSCHSETLEAERVIDDRQFVEIDGERFDTVMKAIGPRVKTRVVSRMPALGDDELSVDLTFMTLDDFAPEKVAEQVPALCDLLSIREQLEDFLKTSSDDVDAEKQVAELLRNKSIIDNVISSEGKIPQEYEGFEFRGFEQSLESGLGEKDRERLQLMLYANGWPGTAKVLTSAVRLVILLIVRIDRLLTEQINEILHAPEVQEVEGTWRGLRYLVDNTETDRDLKIRVMNIKKDELAQELGNYKGELWGHSPIFRKIYTDVYTTFGAEPFGIIIGAYEFTNEARDVALLRSISRICALAHAPFIAAAAPGLFRIESWKELSNARELEKIVSGPHYASWQALRESEEARYVYLTMPRVLARLPYGPDNHSIRGFAFEEQVHDQRHNVWMSAAFVMGVNISRSYKLYGWCARIRGVEAGGTVNNLPIHTLSKDSGSAIIGPTEVAIDDRREVELSRLGLMPILHRRNSRVSAFIGAHSLQDDEARAERLVDPEAKANERLSANLSYLLPVCRFGHYLKAIARDKVGTFKERSDMQTWLSEWIWAYVHANPAVADDFAKAKRPLAAAEVQVDSVESRPGYYHARFYLRPHYQLEGINASLRLSSEVPSMKSV